MAAETTPRDAETAGKVVGRIRARRWETGADILEHGEDLTALKDILGHNRFVETITEELGYSARKCDACIRAYEAFGRHKDVAGALPAATLLRLTQKSTPPSVRERLRKDWDSGKRFDQNVIRQLVISARDATRESERRARQSIARRRKLSLRPRAERERRKRELDRERRFDAAKAAIRMLEPTRVDAVAQFLARATPQECKNLAYQATHDRN